MHRVKCITEGKELRKHANMARRLAFGKTAKASPFDAEDHMGFYVASTVTNAV